MQETLYTSDSLVLFYGGITGNARSHVHAGEMSHDAGILFRSVWRSGNTAARLRSALSSQAHLSYRGS